MTTKRTRDDISKEIYRLQQELAEAVRRDFPIGARVFYRCGRGGFSTAYALVVRHLPFHSGNCLRVFVEGEDSGKRYWISVSRLTNP